jgi:chemotaxis protein MotA
MFTKLLGMTIFGGSLAIVFLFESSATANSAFRIFHWPAMVLTGIGPFGLVLLCTDHKVMRKTLQLLLGLSPVKLANKHEKALAVLQKMSQDLYTRGTKSLEGLDVRNFSPLFQRTVERLEVRMPTADIRELTRHERGRAEMRLSQSVHLLNLAVRLAPSVGMLGTILGMVRLLASLQDPSQIGSHMSLALLTTFYGLFFSLALWTPMAQRLERLLGVELSCYDQVAHFLELLEKRKPATYFVDLSEQGYRNHLKAVGQK